MWGPRRAAVLAGSLIAWGSPVAFGIAGGQAAPAVKVLGTVQATVDGTARTWYVVSGESGGRPYASGVWRRLAPDRHLIALGGYETATPPLDTFQWGPDGMPRSYGSYRGSTIGLTLELKGAPAPFRVTLPDGQTSVIYASEAKLNSLETTYMTSKGQVEVTAVSIAGGLAKATGTFSGTLERMMGDGTVEITQGRFEVSGMPDLATLLPKQGALRGHAAGGASPEGP